MIPSEKFAPNSNKIIVNNKKYIETNKKFKFKHKLIILVHIQSKLKNTNNLDFKIKILTQKKYFSQKLI